MREGIAGTTESNDVLVTVRESDKLSIDIQSIVDLLFHDQIEKVILDTLQEMNISKIEVKLIDKGALDYTIRARLITAIKRMESSHD